MLQLFSLNTPGVSSLIHSETELQRATEVARKPSSQVLTGLLGIRDRSRVSDLTSALVTQLELPLPFLVCWTSQAGEPFPFRPAGCNLLWSP